MRVLIPIAIIVLGFAGCKGSDFAGSLESLKNTNSGDANGDNPNLADDGATDVDANGDGTGVDDGNGDSGIPTTCTNGRSSFAPVIDFESIAENTNPKDAFVTSHKVKLIAKGPGKLVVRKTSRKDEPQLPKNERAWFCIKCSGQPSYNRLMNADSENRIKRKVLSTDDALDRKTTGLRMEYTTPVSRVSFDLIDLDGNEQWTIKLFGASGQVLKSEVYDAARGYKEKRTENGKYKTFQYARSANDIYAVEFKGKKGNEHFGFAFDNFNTGTEICNP